MTGARPEPSAEVKLELVLAVLRGERTTEEVCAEYGIPAATINNWQAALLAGGRAALAATDAGDAADARDARDAKPPARGSGGNISEYRSATTFVGRRKAADDVRRQLGTARLITLTGPGGVGKTRLALHVAARVERSYPDGAWVVEFAEVTQAHMVPAAILDALHLRARANRSPQDSLLAELRDRALLLVLDNCEHLLDAAAAVAADLLRTAPGVRVLATSREALNIPGEQVWPVPALSVPAEGVVGTPAESESLDLLQQRASEVMPGFTIGPDNRAAAIRLCARLDGMPLAIELAAVRLRALGLDRLLEHLEDHFEAMPTPRRGAPRRHQTLRAAVAWSHALCSEREQSTWARLSVFVGGFDVDAALSVCTSGDLDGQAVVDAVATLVDKSILVREVRGASARYRMLETLRQYGRELLREAGSELDVRRRHFEHYMALSARIEAEWAGSAQARGLSALRRERANLREAMAFGFAEHPDPLAGARMVIALKFLWVTGSSREGDYWLDRAMQGPARESDLWPWLLLVSGWSRQLGGDWERSSAELEECLELASADGDSDLAGLAQQFLGITSLLECSFARAVELLESALVEARAGRQPWNGTSLLGLAALGWALLELGEVEQSAETCAEVQRLGADAGEQWAHSWADWVLGLHALRRDDHVQTQTFLRRGLRIKRELGDWFGIACAVEVLAWDLAATGSGETAAFLLGANARLWEEIGRPMFGFATFLDRHDACVAQLRADLGAAEFDRALAAGAAATPDAALARALDIRPPARAGRSAPPVSPLTRREREVAALVTEGLSNKEIAQRLVLAVRTAETHVENILTKLGLRSRRQIGDWMTQQEAVGGPAIPHT